MTLNGLMAIILHYFAKFDSFHSQLRTRCSAIAERPRCTVCYSFRQKYNTRTGRQSFTDII